MADITIEAAGVGRGMDSIISPVYSRNTNDEYRFFINSGNDLKYRKSTDGGATWGSQVSIPATATDNISGFCVWAKEWTTGVSTDVRLYIWYIDLTNNDVRFRTLDVDTDTLGTERVCKSLTSVDTGGPFWGQTTITGTRLLGGNLLAVFYGDNDGEHGCVRSTDDGVNWTDRADPANSGNAVDPGIVLPSDAADTNDALLLYMDKGDDRLDKQLYDDSADSWSLSTIDSSVTWEGSTDPLNMSAVFRPSDKLVMVIYWNEPDATTADLKCREEGSATSNAKTDIISNSAESGACALTINNQNDDLTAFYGRGGTWQASVDVFKKKSTDDGGVWGTEAAYSEDTADDIRGIWSPVAIGDNGGKVQAMFFNHDLADYFTNVVNDEAIAAVVAAGGFPAWLPKSRSHLVSR